MSGQTPAPTAPDPKDADTGAPTTEPGAATTADPKDDKDDSATDDPQALRAAVDKWKALSRKNEADFKKAEKDAQAWRDHQDSQKTDEERQAEADSKLVEERDTVVRENALLKLAVKHKLDQDGLDEINDLLDGVPADKFAERAEKLAARLAAQQDAKRDPAPDTTLGRETPPSGGGSSDFLRDAMRRR